MQRSKKNKRDCECDMRVAQATHGFAYYARTLTTHRTRVLSLIFFAPFQRIFEQNVNERLLVIQVLNQKFAYRPSADSFPE